MGISKQDDIDLSKIKPQPYDSFEEEDRKREEAREKDATEVHPPLTEQQKKAVREQSGINPIDQTVSDIVKDVAKD